MNDSWKRNYGYVWMYPKSQKSSNPSPTLKRFIFYYISFPRSSCHLPSQIKNPDFKFPKPKTHIHFPFSTSPQTRINTPRFPVLPNAIQKPKKVPSFLPLFPKTPRQIQPTKRTWRNHYKEKTSPPLMITWLPKTPRAPSPRQTRNIPKPRGQNRHPPCIPCSEERLLCWVQCPSLQCRGLWNSRPFWGRHLCTPPRQSSPPALLQCLCLKSNVGSPCYPAPLKP